VALSGHPAIPGAVGANQEVFKGGLSFGPRRARSGSYRLLVAIQAAIQICFHVCARQLQRVPEEYAECFAILGEAGIIPQELSRNLQKMARFRNMLVHLYWTVDYERLYDIIHENLDDLRRFVRAIGELL